MGTKLEYAIDVLATSPESNRFSVHCVNDWDYLQTRRLKQNYQRIGLDKFHTAMDRNLEKHNMESIKKTMQMHEDIFKHQVRELHRLYGVQKIMTNELRSKHKQNRLWGPLTTTDINHSQVISQNNSTSQTPCGYNFRVQCQRDYNPITSRERSGSCSGDTGMRITRGFDLERPAADLEDISTGINVIDPDQQAGPSSSLQRSNSNKMSIYGSDEDSEVDLTLSIGGNSSSKKRSSEAYQQPHHKETRELDSSASFKSDRGEDFSGPNTPMSSSSTTFDQERKRPHWLLQGLSINRT